MWGKEILELEEITGTLLHFHQRKNDSDENFQNEGLVYKGNRDMEETSFEKDQETTNLDLN